jgi:hypothetical protein
MGSERIIKLVNPRNRVNSITEFLSACKWVARKRALATVRFRCRPISNFSVASVSNTDGMPPIERQLYGTSTVKIFLAPESCHPGAPASGLLTVSLKSLKTAPGSTAELEAPIVNDRFNRCNPAGQWPVLLAIANVSLVTMSSVAWTTALSRCCLCRPPPFRPMSTRTETQSAGSGLPSSVRSTQRSSRPRTGSHQRG